MVQLTSYPTPVDGIRHTEENVQTTVDTSNLGSGTLYITESEVTWLNPNGEGIQLQYKQISLHAISRDTATFPKEHLLLHYDGKIQNINDDSANESDEDDDSVSAMTEIKFAPQQPASLDQMFASLSHCQTLHPDDDCQLSDDDFQDAEENGGGDGFYTVDGTDGFFTDETGLDQLNEEGRANLARFNQMLMGGTEGQGDADLAAQTNQLTLMNGHHENGDNEPNGQFEDMDDE